MNKIFKVTAFMLAIAIGVFLVIFGGYDDSPGGQLLGVVIGVIGVVGLVRAGRLT